MSNTRPKKKRFGSRGKGSVAEREVAKLLQEWWGQVEPDAIFCRTPLSGGWGGKDLRAGFNASGDLMTTSPTFPMAVEVKRREGWTWEALRAGEPSPVWGWWQQAQAAALEMGKLPVLFFRRSREEWSVLLPLDFALREAGVALPSAKLAWTREALRAVHYGQLLPVCYEWDVIRQLDPRDFLKRPQSALRRPKPR